MIALHRGVCTLQVMENSLHVVSSIFAGDPEFLQCTGQVFHGTCPENEPILENCKRIRRQPAFSDFIVHGFDQESVDTRYHSNIAESGGKMMATKSFLEFLDSTDIRRYQRNTAFTPAEQAVLISMSVKQSVTEKMAALRQLAAQYSSAEFGADRVRHTFPDFREGVLEYNDTRMQEALEKRMNQMPLCFLLICTEAGYSEEKPVCFSNFERGIFLSEQALCQIYAAIFRNHSSHWRMPGHKLNTSITGIPNMCTICSFRNAHRVWI